MTDNREVIDRIATKVQRISEEGVTDTIRITLQDMYAMLSELRALQTAIMPFAAAAMRLPPFPDETCISLPVAIGAYKKCIWLNNTKIA